jgi:hypothetical protein
MMGQRRDSRLLGEHVRKTFRVGDFFADDFEGDGRPAPVAPDSIGPIRVGKRRLADFLENLVAAEPPPHEWIFRPRFAVFIRLQLFDPIPKTEHEHLLSRWVSQPST